MAKMVKTFMVVMVISTFSLFTNTEAKAASNTIGDECQYESEESTNPDFSTLNCLLTETAFKYDVPPEIVKAVAEGESGDWRHFDENGEVIITPDNGIGIMQITNQEMYDEKLLKDDITYNIKAGVEMLDHMFNRSDLPTINDGERNVLEHWYFAIMAYNGTKPINSPIIQETGGRNSDAYQENIIDIIDEFGLIDMQELPFSPEDFNYDSDSTDNIEFVTMEYNFNLPFTKTKHSFEEGQKVNATANVHIRTNPTTSSNSQGTATTGETLTINGPFEYDANPESKNHFVWYPVERTDGTTGYVASSYLKFKFTDLPDKHYAKDEIYYLYNRGILKGIGNNEFGMTEDLTRWQVVLLINRANNVSLDNRPNPGFEDVPEEHDYYNEIAAAVDEGLFEGTSDTTFEPNSTLTRGEMVVVLQRLYQFPDAQSSHPFTDVVADWYTDEVAILYENGITNGVGETEFGPSIHVSRDQFAVFMTRAMDESFRLN